MYLNPWWYHNSEHIYNLTNFYNMQHYSSWLFTYLSLKKISPALQTCITSNPIFSPSRSQSVQMTRNWAVLISRSNVRWNIQTYSFFTIAVQLYFVNCNTLDFFFKKNIMSLRNLYWKKIPSAPVTSTFVLLKHDVIFFLTLPKVWSWPLRYVPNYCTKHWHIGWLRYTNIHVIHKVPCSK